MMQRISLALSVLALAVALTGVAAVKAGLIVTSKQIRNGTILTQDIHRGGVTSPDIQNGSVGGPDVGANEIEPSDVDLPPAETASPPVLSAPVGLSDFVSMGTLYTATKEQAESGLEVSLSGVAISGPETNCQYELRANGQPPSAGGGQFVAGTTAVNVATTALFQGVPAGSVTIELWGKASQFMATELHPQPTCLMGVQVDTTLIVVEQVV